LGVQDGARGVGDGMRAPGWAGRAPPSPRVTATQHPGDPVGREARRPRRPTSMSPVDNPVRIRGILRSVTVDRPGDSGELPASGGEKAQLSWFPVMNCLWITDSSVNPRLAWGYSALP